MSVEQLPGLWTIYLVWWRDLGVVKVGRTQRTVTRHHDNHTGLPDRVWSLVTARLDGRFELDVAAPEMVRDMLADAEVEILARLAAQFLPAFGSEAEGKRLLPGGRGFTECFRVETAEDFAAVRRIFSEGIALYADQSAAVAAAVRLQRSTDRIAARARARDRSWTSPVRGRRGPSGGAASQDARRDTRARHVDHGAGTRGAPVAPRRSELASPVRRPARPELTPSAGVARGAARGCLAASAPAGVHEAFTKVSRNFHGKGERERESERARGRVGARERERGALFRNLELGTRSPGASVTFLLSAPTVGNGGQLRTLRHSSPCFHDLETSGRERRAAEACLSPPTRRRADRVHHRRRPHRNHLNLCTNGA